eukprot:4530291-Pleurochrysis_carterae.AAC.1
MRDSKRGHKETECGECFEQSARSKAVNNLHGAKLGIICTEQSWEESARSSAWNNLHGAKLGRICTEQTG